MRIGNLYRTLLGVSVLLVLGIAAVSPTAAQAQDRKIYLLTGNNYHPYSDKKLLDGGLATAMVKLVFEEMGFEPQMVFADWQAGYKAVKEGRYLATFPYIKTQERIKEVYFSDELFSVRNHVFQHGGKPRLNQLEDLAGKILCVPEGWAVPGFLKEMTDSGQIRLVRGPGIHACFEALYSQKIDIVAVDHRLGTEIAERIDSSRWYKSKRFDKDGIPHYVAFTRKHPKALKWVATFNNTLQKLQEDGRMPALVRGYYAED